MTAVANNSDAIVNTRCHHRSSRVSGCVQTTLTAFKQFITRCIGVILQFIVDIANVLVVVLVVVARALTGGDAHERGKVGGFRRILFVFDEALHLCFHLRDVFSGNFSQNDIWIRIIARDFCEIVVRFVSADGRGGELCIVTHNNHKS